MVSAAVVLPQTSSMLIVLEQRWQEPAKGNPIMFRCLPHPHLVLFRCFAAGATLSAGKRHLRLLKVAGAVAPRLRPDISGRSVSLGDYAGKIVVLEWTNDGCPFVGKHYNSGNMQALQQKYTAGGVVWSTIASSAPGEQGYVTPGEAKADLARWQR